MQHTFPEHLLRPGCVLGPREDQRRGRSRSLLPGAHRLVRRQTGAHLPNKSQGIRSAKIVRERLIPPGRSGEITFVWRLGSGGTFDERVVEGSCRRSGVGGVLRAWARGSRLHGTFQKKTNTRRPTHYANFSLLQVEK